MNYDLKIRQEAAKELSGALSWYEEQQTGLGEIFETAIRRKLNQISRNPYHYKAEYNQFHQALTEKFPFLIVYIVDETVKQITVIAIFHTSRNPNKKFQK
ncbi:type II toxin-antitoxin system RelE/ParE family toxin [Mucilaginibacter sp. FT3.2]|uniref:type II toxin-antitoxin system RelE/ParE family toxin n=1 Tax=Mucilaginibacter sp. FT3.2 TaxID=2723090 RepID=UPI0016211A30|nr:type II toxin-antitoxin system RelE/ParE family toxin [Mucilaginibacter sp. FT3.2]MBB6232259.1 plasmid stabilization system protein ParE [Mucilaginibacter sp. FT3.2]